MLRELRRTLKQWADPMPGVIRGVEYRRLRRLQELKPGTATIAGHSIAFSDAPGALHSAEEIFLDQVYRFECSRPDPFIIDAGANIGLSVLYFKQRFPLARVIAFEPDPAISNMLRANVGAMPGVRVEEAAAWTENGSLEFFSEGSLAGSSELNWADRGTQVTVKAIDLNSILATEPVDFLKIDIEGGENALIPHIAPHLGNVANLFFEYHALAGRDQQLAELLHIVSAAGFRYVIDGVQGPAHPFVERVERGFEMQLNISCFRPRKG